MNVPVSRIIGRAPGAERFAGIRRIYGKRRFMRSITDPESRSATSIQ